MATVEHTQILAHGVAAWNEWRLKNPTLKPDLRDVSYENFDLKGVDFREADLTHCNFSKARLEGADFTKAICSSSQFQEAVLRGARLQGATLDHTNWSGADLTEADLTSADLSNARFTGAKLESTKFWHITFVRGHANMIDGSDAIQFGRRDRWLNWARLRKVGQFPLFGVSWGAFLMALITINTIALLNENRFVQSLHYPIPVPLRSMLILLSTALLVVGSTVYRLKCPDRIQTFSETEWVEQHKQPRLLYLAENLNRWGWMGRWQWICTVSIGLGGFLALWLIGERLWLAGFYICKTVILPAL